MSRGYSGGSHPTPAPKPKPYHCALKKGVFPTNRAEVGAQCSKVNDYFLYYYNYGNSSLQLSKLDYVEQMEEWWMLNFLTRVASVDAEFLSYKDFEDKLPGINSAWNANCRNEAREYSCFRAFPECKKVKGHQDVPGTAKCEAECKKVDTCIQSVETACVTAKAKADNSEIIQCFTYADLFPEQRYLINHDGITDGQREVRDCKALCEENHPPHPNSAPNTLVGLSFFAALFMLYRA